MITCGNIKSTGSAYLKTHLAKNDYWQEGEREIGGRWFGGAAARLGLVPGSAVTAEQFGMLSDNLHPVTGEKLTVRNDSKRKSFSDIQLSAPKDVSVLGILGDERVAAAFQESVNVGLEALQRFAAVRERRGEMATSDESRQTGNLVAAVYQHDSSRLLDPQLHAHAVVGNVTWDETTGRFMALQSRDMLRASAFCRRAMYDDLAARLTGLGYECYGMNADGFQVRGVEHLRERFSKRSATIEEAAAAFEKRNHRPPTDDERREITLETRSAKLAEVSTEAVRAAQRAQLSKAEQKELAGLVAAATASAAGEDRPSPAPVADAETLDKYLAVGFADANERASVAWEWDAMDAALAHAQAEGVHLDPHALGERLTARGSGEAADLHSAPGFRVTTAQVLAEEREMANLALAGRDAFASSVGDVARLEAQQARARAEGGLVLSDEQMDAARSLASSKDGCSVLVGDAGTGKTASLNVLREASDKKWVALGPTTRARNELQKNGFSDADTLQSFLLSAKKQKAALGSVLLVDEAGTMGTPEMRKLLEVARREKCQVVLVGDPKQHASVVRGDALRAILRESTATARPGADHALPVARLATVRRQEVREDREISEMLARGEFGQAVERQQAAGYVTEQGDEKKLIEEAAKYLVARRRVLVDEPRRPGQAPGVVLGITPRWEDAGKLNAAMRPLLRKAGLLRGEDRALRIIEPDGSFTAAGKRLAENYRPGLHALTFVRDAESIGAKAGQSWIVEGVEKDGLRVRRMDVPAPRLGQRRQAPAPPETIPWADLKDAKVGQIKEISLAAGDDILLRASCKTGKKTSVANGAIQKVKAIGKDGRIQLVGGGVLPADFRAYTHGYGITSHKSQGASESEAVVILGNSACASASRRQWYVSSSRHKVAAKYFVASVEKVRTALRRDDSRELAVEMIERKAKAATVAQSPSPGTKQAEPVGSERGKVSPVPGEDVALGPVAFSSEPSAAPVVPAAPVVQAAAPSKPAKSILGAVRAPAAAAPSPAPARDNIQTNPTMIESDKNTPVASTPPAPVRKSALGAVRAPVAAAPEAQSAAAKHAEEAMKADHLKRQTAAREAEEKAVQNEAARIKEKRQSVLSVTRTPAPNRAEFRPEEREKGHQMITAASGVQAAASTARPAATQDDPYALPPDDGKGFTPEDAEGHETETGWESETKHLRPSTTTTEEEEYAQS